MLGRFFRRDRTQDRAGGSPRDGAGGATPAGLIGEALEHHRRGQLAQAQACYRRVLEEQPENVDALHFLGVIAYQRGEHEEAEQLIGRALSLNAANAPAQNNLGNVLRERGRAPEAIDAYRRALALAPDYVDAHLNLAATLVREHRLEEAEAAYRQLLAVKPDAVEGLINLGNVLRERDRPDESIASYREAIRLRPDAAMAHYNLGCYLRDRGRTDEAIESLQRATALDPGMVDGHVALGNILSDIDRRPEAVAAYERALALDPENIQVRWAHTMSQVPAVYEYDTQPGERRAAFAVSLAQLDASFVGERVLRGFSAVGVQQPFTLAYQEENNRELLGRYGALCARLMADWLARQRIPQGSRSRSGAVRVGIVSDHFRNHSVWNAIVKGWFGELDRERFAIHAYYMGKHEDTETAYAKERAARFVSGSRGLEGWVQAVLEDAPDVLIYPEIGMDPMTARLASLRLAPVQVTTWGHPETSGFPTIDYFISAEDFEPAGAEGNYTERLVRLPHLGCFYARSGVEPMNVDLRDFGVERDRPVFVCPGVPFKYGPAHDRVLVDIALALGRCRFLMFQHQTKSLSERLARRLRASFARYGLEFEEFVTFLPWLSRGAFFGTMRAADAYLDSIGFSGFNTAMQAVECGVPIVTREGAFLRGRLGSGILDRMGLRELVADSDERYVAIAVKLAGDAPYRDAIREKIRAACGPLFEDRAPIRALEEFLSRRASRGG
jgi:predicted O-linked N-acetylglucosamine transferase (SPINDLY family)